MSLKRISKVIELDLPSSEKVLLLLLANSANDETGECFPSQKYLSKTSGLTRETVNRLIKKMEKKGLIEIRHKFRDDGGMRANTYTILPEKEPPSDLTSQGAVTTDHRGGYSQITAINSNKETPIRKPISRRENGNEKKSASGRALLAEQRIAAKCHR